MSVSLPGYKNEEINKILLALFSTQVNQNYAVKVESPLWFYSNFCCSVYLQEGRPSMRERSVSVQEIESSKSYTVVSRLNDFSLDKFCIS